MSRACLGKRSNFHKEAEKETKKRTKTERKKEKTKTQRNEQRNAERQKRRNAERKERRFRTFRSSRSAASAPACRNDASASRTAVCEALSCRLARCFARRVSTFRTCKSVAGQSQVSLTCQSNSVATRFDLPHLFAQSDFPGLDLVLRGGGVCSSHQLIVLSGREGGGGGGRGGRGGSVSSSLLIVLSGHTHLRGGELLSEAETLRLRLHKTTERGRFSQLFPCLSRACLGKRSVFMYETAQKMCVFRTSRAASRAMLCWLERCSNRSRVACVGTRRGRRRRTRRRTRRGRGTRRRRRRHHFAVWNFALCCCPEPVLANGRVCRTTRRKTAREETKERTGREEKRPSFVLRDIFSHLELVC